jgi:hypothetical protein
MSVEVNFQVHGPSSKLDALQRNLPDGSFLRTGRELGIVEYAGDATILITAILGSSVLAEIIRALREYLTNRWQNLGDPQKAENKDEITINITIRSSNIDEQALKRVEILFDSLEKTQ